MKGAFLSQKGQRKLDTGGSTKPEK